VIKVVIRHESGDKVYSLGEFPPDQVEHIVALAKAYGALVDDVPTEFSFAWFNTVQGYFEIVMTPSDK
jgi:hypothetical protein